MANPVFIEERPTTLAEVKELLQGMEKRDEELNFRSTKSKEYLENFTVLSVEQKEALLKKLMGLELTRLREEHFTKIIDFLPATADELKVVLQAYPLSLSKKDQQTVVDAVKEFTS